MLKEKRSSVLKNFKCLIFNFFLSSVAGDEDASEVLSDLSDEFVPDNEVDKNNSSGEEDDLNGLPAAVLKCTKGGCRRFDTIFKYQSELTLHEK